jgi:hypothetical protein
MPTPDIVDSASWWSGFDGTLRSILLIGVPLLLTVVVAGLMRNAVQAAADAFDAPPEDGHGPAVDTPMVTADDDEPFPGFDPDMYGPVDA